MVLLKMKNKKLNQKPKPMAQIKPPSFWEKILKLFSKKEDVVQLVPQEPLITLSNSEKLRVDGSDANLFYDTLNKKISIRVIRQKDKDQCVFATSIPHKFMSVNASLMKNAISQLTEVKISQTHELLITKSPAAKFSDIGEDILNFIITHIREVNNWKAKKIVFSILNDYTTCYFSSTIPICRFKNLDKKLSLIKGLEINKDGSVMGIDKKEFEGIHYDFCLYRGMSFPWKELMSEIKKVFESYSEGGVEFKYG